MSTIRMNVVSVNGHPVNFVTTANTCPRGSDQEKVENIHEARLINRIDSRIERLHQLTASSR